MVPSVTRNHRNYHLKAVRLKALWEYFTQLYLLDPDLHKLKYVTLDPIIPQKLCHVRLIPCRTYRLKWSSFGYNSGQGSGRTKNSPQILKQKNSLFGHHLDPEFQMRARSLNLWPPIAEEKERLKTMLTLIENCSMDRITLGWAKVK